MLPEASRGGAELPAQRTSTGTAVNLCFGWRIFDVAAALVSGDSATAAGGTPIPSTGPITGTPS
ncbi:MAG TPA: hypothetical protein VGL12_07945 [Roseiarcus sp.]|jgi:hypothetical protein